MNTEKAIILGSRGSILALAQTNWVKNALEKNYPHLHFSIQIVETQGDKDLHSHFANTEVSLKSFFTKEIEKALLEKRIDIAVHSMKDMPSESPQKLICGAIPIREDARDVLVSKNDIFFPNLPKGAVIGTSSLRRTMNIKQARPDLIIKPLRGNIHTRLQKLETGEYDAIVLAAAGLKRVGLEDKITEYLNPKIFPPAPAQGALYIQCREDDDTIRSLLSSIHNTELEKIIRIEREFSKIFDGGCHTPMGCYSEVTENRIHFYSMYSDGEKVYHSILDEDIANSQQIAKKAAEEIKKQYQKNPKGKAYILGVGPGDFELITLKAKRIIEEADCVIYDRLINPHILDFMKENAERIYLGKENTEGGKIQETIHETLVQKCLEGKIVARVKGGDPFVFGRGGEEIEALRKHGIAFEVVPGITSAIAVPAYAGIPVTHRGLAKSFHVFTGHTIESGTWHDFKTIAQLEGSLIFLMGVKNLDRIVQDLLKNGKDANTPIAIMEQGATEKQRITIGTLDNILEIAKKKEIKPPAITIVGDVVSLHENFTWFQTQNVPKKILITRDVKQAKEMSEEILRRGGIPKELSFLEIEELSLELKDLSKYSAILFNSPNGVKSFLKNISDLRSLANIKIGAIGAKTKEILESYKIIPDFTPEEYLVEKLAEEVIKYTKKDDSILIVTSDISPCNTELYQQRYGRHYEKIVAYKTKKKKIPLDTIQEYLQDVDIITFLSSSTVKAFYESIEGDLSLIREKEIASIGPMTSETLRKYGMKIHYEAKQYTALGLIAEIFQER